MPSIARSVGVLLSDESSEELFGEIHKENVVAQFGVDHFPVQRLSENEAAFTVRGRYKKPVQAVRPPSLKESQQTPPQVNLRLSSPVFARGPKPYASAAS